MVTEVDVVEQQLADVLGAGGVDGGQGDGEAGRWCGCRTRRLGDFVVFQWKYGAVVVRSNAYACGRVAEDDAVLPAVSEERPQDAERVATFVALQGIRDCEDVVTGDFPQVVVVMRPAEQDWPDPVEVAPHGVRVAGTCAWPAVVECADPVLDVAPDTRGDAVEFALEPGLERWCPVVVEQPELVEDLRDPTAMTDRGNQLGVADLLIAGMAGQQDDQRLVDACGECV